MSNLKRIVLYGNSLALTTIGANLQERADVEVVRVDSRTPDAADRLTALQPAAVFFDLRGARPEFAITLLNEHPQVVLIGVELESAKMLLLSGRRERALDLQDLSHVLGRIPGTFPASMPGREIARGWIARIPARRRNRALALAGIAMCLVLALGLSLGSGSGTAPLVGAAVDRDLPVVIFAAGMVLGGVSLVLWFHWHRRKTGDGR